MSGGQWNPNSGLLARIYQAADTGRLTNVGGNRFTRRVIQVGDDEFRTLGTRRGCADYMAEFSTYTTFAKGPDKPNEAEEQGEPNTAAFLDCPDPFPI